MTCGNCGQFRETAHYKLAMRRITSDLCAPCHASLSALGMVWVPERRAENVTPIVERRQPAWLERLTAKEFVA